VGEDVGRGSLYEKSGTAELGIEVIPPASSILLREILLSSPREGKIICLPRTMKAFFHLEYVKNGSTFGR
jgi:hypothetical protein